MSGERDGAGLSAAQSELVRKFCAVQADYTRVRLEAQRLNAERREVAAQMRAAGLSTTRAAAAVGLSQPHMTRIMNGGRR